MSSYFNKPSSFARKSVDYAYSYSSEDDLDDLENIPVYSPLKKTNTFNNGKPTYANHSKFSSKISNHELTMGQPLTTRNQNSIEFNQKSVSCTISPSMNSNEKDPYSLNKFKRQDSLEKLKKINSKVKGQMRDS